MSTENLIKKLNKNCEYKDDSDYSGLWDEDDFDSKLNALRQYCSFHKYDKSENDGGVMCDSCAKILLKYKNKWLRENDDTLTDINKHILDRLDRIEKALNIK